MRCPSCGYENRPDVKYCAQCGTAMSADAGARGTKSPTQHKQPMSSRYCAVCGAQLQSPLPKVCPHCGTKVGAPRAQKKRMWLAVVGAFVIALVAAGLVWTLLRRSNVPTVDGAGEVTHNSAMGVGGTAPEGIREVSWSVTHEGDDEPYASGTSAVEAGRWKADWCLLRPGENIVEVSDESGCSVTKTITYENSTLRNIKVSDVVVDEETSIPFVGGQLLVAFDDGIDDQEMAAAIESVGGLELGRLWAADIVQVEVPALKGKPLSAYVEVADDLASREGVLTATPDVCMCSASSQESPDDPWLNEQGKGKDGWDENLPNGTNWGMEAIKANSARNYVNARDHEEVVVGVADGYFNTSHQDLVYSFVSESRADDNRTAYENAVAECKDDKKELEKVQEDLGHGMHVAGIVGATIDNNRGVGGVCAPKLLVSSTRAGIPQDASVNGTCLSILDLLEHGSRVVNFSRGQVYYDEEEREYPELTASIRIKEAALMSVVVRKMLSLRRDSSTGLYRDDFVIVQSAGNGIGNGSGIKGFVGSLYSDLPVDATLSGFFAGITPDFGGDACGIPARDVYDRIIVVGNAELKNGGTSGFFYEQNRNSNGGPRVDVCAPGTNILSTYSDYGYKTLSGTSMAAPHVSGIAALVFSVNPALSGAEVKRIIIETATTTVAVSKVRDRDKFQTESRMVDALAAVRAASGEDMSVTEEVSTLEPIEPTSDNEAVPVEPESTSEPIPAPPVNTIGSCNSFVAEHGDRLLFVARTSEFTSEVVSTNLDGSDVKAITDTGRGIHKLAVTNDGHLLICRIRDDGLWSVRTDGSELSLVTGGVVTACALDDSHSDNSSVVYAVDRDFHGSGSWELHRCASDGSSDQLICVDSSQKPSREVAVPSILGQVDDRVYYLNAYGYDGAKPSDFGVYRVAVTGGDPQQIVPETTDAALISDRIISIYDGSSRAVDTALHSCALDGSDDRVVATLGTGYYQLMNATADYAYIRPSEISDGMLRVDLTTGEVSMIPIAYSSPVDIIGDKLYQRVEDGNVVRSDLDGSNPERIFTYGVSGVQ